MQNLLELIRVYVEDNIGDFHTSRINSISNLSLKRILTKKNPYLYKAKNVTSLDIVKIITDAHVSSNEETIFGDWLEGLALYIAHTVYKGRKSAAKGIDLEFDVDSVRYLVAIKSGPNWGNSSQINKMKADFISARKTLSTSGHKGQVECINGCCYGRDDSYHKGDYQKLCGERFWYLISGRKSLYLDMIEPIGHQALQRNEEFLTAYTASLQRLNAEFIKEYCHANGTINWEMIVRMNSGAKD